VHEKPQYREIRRGRSNEYNGEIEIVFLLLLLFIVAFGFLAKRLGTPYPIVMVVAGLLLSFVPGIPQITLNPDLVFLVVLPPLLYAAAWTTSWRDFRYNLITISLLDFGLVGFTVVAVALVAPLAFGGFDWRLGFVLGAVIAPTDAIAATSIARTVGLPTRIVDILEGESLINDATGCWLLTSPPLSWCISMSRVSRQVFSPSCG
jgi:monovalent cation/hydrogen antiporter